MFEKVVGVLMILVGFKIVFSGFRWMARVWHGMSPDQGVQEGRRILEDLKERNSKERGL